MSKPIVNKPKTSNPSRTTKLEAEVAKLKEAVNQLLEQSGLRPIEEQENTAGPRPIKYGD